MAYDPNCAETKAEIKKQLDALREELEAEHEESVAGLKNKVTELRGDLRKAKAGGGGEDQAKEIERLENELEASKAELKTLNKTHAKAVKDLDAANAGLTTEQAFTKKLLADNGLTEALVANNVDAKFLPAVKAMLGSRVSIEADGDSRKATVDGKSLGDFIKEWSQGDEGKHYVTAPNNSGGGGGGGGGGAGSKKLADLSEKERVDLFNTNRAEFDRLSQEHNAAR